MSFKIGDKVAFYSAKSLGLEANWMSSILTDKMISIRKIGFVSNIQNDLIEVRFGDNSKLSAIVHVKQCRRLVKKRKPKKIPTFNIGDRVSYIFRLDCKKYRGTILYKLDNLDTFIVQTDNSDIVHPVDGLLMKKLFKKESK
jgi:hypothetical protein